MGTQFESDRKFVGVKTISFLRKKHRKIQNHRFKIEGAYFPSGMLRTLTFESFLVLQILIGNLSFRYGSQKQFC